MKKSYVVYLLILILFCTWMPSLKTGYVQSPEGSNDIEIETSHFIVRSQKNYEIFAKEMAVLSESIYDETTTFMNYTPETKIKITLYPARRTLAFVGFAGDGIVLSYGCPFSTESGGTSYLDRKRQIAHEFTHFLLFKKISAFQDPLITMDYVWVSEGLAMYVSDMGYNEMRSKAAVAYLLESDMVPPSLKEIYGNPYAGFLSYTVISYMIDVYGKEALDFFLSRLSAWDAQESFHETMRRTFERAFGLSIEEFEDTWKAYLTEFTRDLPELESEYELSLFPVVNQGHPGFFIGSEWRENKILAVSTIDRDLNVYIINVSEGTAERITSGLGAEFDPKFSPDGSQIAYTARKNNQYAIYCMNADGSQVNQLTDEAALDIMGSWSPDGKTIAFTSSRTGNYDIFIMDTDGSHVTRLTGDMANEGWPVFSPDGKEILFVSDRAGTYDLYIMDSDGSHVWQLTNTPEYENYPAFSPDGRYIAFISQTETGSTVQMMDRDGHNRKLIVPMYWMIDDEVIFSYGIPLWSPHGDRILFRCGSILSVVSMVDGEYAIWKLWAAVVLLSMIFFLGKTLHGKK